MTRRIRTPTPNSSISRMSATLTRDGAQIVFQPVERAYAEQLELAGIDRDTRLLPEQAVESRSPQRNAADMPCRLPVTVVEARAVGMGIQPQDEKLTAGFAAMARDPFTEPIDSE